MSEREPSIEVAADAESLARRAADFVLESAAPKVRSGGRFRVALSGGSTPKRLYEILAERAPAEPPFWDAVDFFLVDERFVPHDDPRSNIHMIKTALLDRVPLPKAQWRAMAGEGDPDQAAADYERQLRAVWGDPLPRFDLILLGLGDDGHTASLFPGSSALREKEKWVASLWLPSQSMYRLTLTEPVLNHAARVAFLVAGASKASIVKQVLRGSRELDRWPSQRIAPSSGTLHWLLDSAAASELHRAAGASQGSSS